MISVDVVSEEKAWSKKLRNKEFFFKQICRSFPRKYKFINKKVSFSLLLSNNLNIKKLNKSFRSKNKATDILSFPYYKKTKIFKNTYIGDIIISYNYINKSKPKSFKKELIKIFIHGFLHLLGFNHVKNNDYKKMLKEEERIYKSVISKLN